MSPPYSNLPQNDLRQGRRRESSFLAYDHGAETGESSPRPELLIPPLQSSAIHSRHDGCLILSHCLPQPQGSASQQRAWQLLTCLPATLRTYIWCWVDLPVHLEHWRILRRRCHGLQMVPTPLAWRLARYSPQPLARLLEYQAASRLVRQLRTHPLPANVRFVLCTHPALLPASLAVQVEQRVCDLAGLLEAWQNAPALPARWYQTLNALCDLVLVRDSQQAATLKTLIQTPLIILPQDPNLSATSSNLQLKTYPLPYSTLAKAA